MIHKDRNEWSDTFNYLIWDVETPEPNDQTQIQSFDKERRSKWTWDVETLESTRSKKEVEMLKTLSVVELVNGDGGGTSFDEEGRWWMKELRRTLKSSEKNHRRLFLSMKIWEDEIEKISRKQHRLPKQKHNFFKKKLI